MPGAARVTTYDPTRILTVRIGLGRESHRLERGRARTLCGLDARQAQATMDRDASCRWCELTLAARRSS